VDKGLVSASEELT